MFSGARNLMEALKKQINRVAIFDQTFFLNCSIQFPVPENMGIDTKFVALSRFNPKLCRKIA